MGTSIIDDMRVRSVSEVLQELIEKRKYELAEAEHSKQFWSERCAMINESIERLNRRLNEALQNERGQGPHH